MYLAYPSSRRCPESEKFALSLVARDWAGPGWRLAPGVGPRAGPPGRPLHSSIRLDFQAFVWPFGLASHQAVPRATASWWGKPRRFLREVKRI